MVIVQYFVSCWSTAVSVASCDINRLTCHYRFDSVKFSVFFTCN